MIETRFIIVEHTHTVRKKDEKTFHDTCNSETSSIVYQQ